jgi:hypothetical protein
MIGRRIEPPFARLSNPWAEPKWLKDLAMESSDLFSHPYQPEAVPTGDRSTEPVQAPVFSDRPGNDSTADTPPTS